MTTATQAHTGIPAGCPVHTPWGTPHFVSELAPGIFAVSTSSHGGIYVSESALRCIPEMFRQGTFTRHPQWYEEDSDWLIPAYFFPDAFPAEDRDAVARRLRMHFPRQWAEFLDQTAGK